MNKKSTALIVILIAVCSPSCSSPQTATDGGASDASTQTDAQVALDASVDAVVVADAATDSPLIKDDAPALGCEAAGNYELESYFCDTTDITSAWVATIATTTAVISTTATGDCEAQLLYQATACTEGERVEFKIGPSVSMSFKGIDACGPPSCKFSTNDAPCLVGDRKVDKTGSVTVTQGGINRVTIESDLGDNVCPGVAKNRIVLRQK